MSSSQVLDQESEQLFESNMPIHSFIHLHVWLKMSVVPSRLRLEFEAIQTKWEGCKRETYRSTKEDIKASGQTTQSNTPENRRCTQTKPMALKLVYGP